MNKVKLSQKSLKTYYEEYSTVFKILKKKIQKVLVEMIWTYHFDVKDKKYNHTFSMVKHLHEVCLYDNYYWNVHNREYINRAFKEFKIVDDLDFIHQEIGQLNFIDLLSSTHTFYNKSLKYKKFLYHEKTKKVLIIGKVNLENFIKCKTVKCSKCSKKMIIHQTYIRQCDGVKEVIKDCKICNDCRKNNTRDTKTKNKKKKIEKSKNYTISYPNLFIDEDILRCLGCGIELTEEQSKYGQKCKPCNLKGKTKQCRKNGCAKLIKKEYEFCYKHKK